MTSKECVPYLEQELKQQLLKYYNVVEIILLCNVNKGLFHFAVGMKMFSACLTSVLFSGSSGVQHTSTMSIFRIYRELISHQLKENLGVICCSSCSKKKCLSWDLSFAWCAYMLTVLCWKKQYSGHPSSRLPIAQVPN